MSITYYKKSLWRCYQNKHFLKNIHIVLCSQNYCIEGLYDSIQVIYVKHFMYIHNGTFTLFLWFTVTKCLYDCHCSMVPWAVISSGKPPVNEACPQTGCVTFLMCRPPHPLKYANPLDYWTSQLHPLFSIQWTQWNDHWALYSTRYSTLYITLQWAVCILLEDCIPEAASP